MATPDESSEVPARVAQLLSGPEHQRRFTAQVLLAVLMFGMSAVVEVAVPVVRALRGRRGVQVGPAVGSLAAFVGGFVWSARMDPEVDDVGGGPLAVVRDHALEIAAVGLPALGALLPGTVVARRRSPLLAWALVPLPRVVGAVVLAWSVDRARERAAGRR